MHDADAVRTCPHCRTRDVPRLVLWPGRRTGTATDWQCRSCGRFWSDAEILALSA